MCLIILDMSDGVGNDDKMRLISLADAARHYGFSPDYFGQLAKKGRIKAEKFGPIWMTTLADVEVYLLSRKKRGVFKDVDID